MKSKLLFAVFLIATILLLADLITPIEIESIKLYWALLFISSTITIIYFERLFLNQSNKIISKIFAILFGLFIVIRIIFLWGSDWKTQIIIFQNLHLANRTIEFQLQDIGAFGYKRRTIDKLKLIPFVSFIKEVDENNLDTLTWKKVDIDVNEMGLKGG